MKDGFPTVSWPNDPTKYYVQLGYRTWFYGPFDSVEDVQNFRRTMTERDPYWNYDGAGTCRGNPAATDVMQLEWLKV